MTHANIDDLLKVYAARIIELERQLGECSGALEGADKQLRMLRGCAWTSKVTGYVHIAIHNWAAIMGDLP